jgi:hypothetical protein
MTFDDLKKEVMTQMENKPSCWRNGQFVFNYIDEKYGVARTVQFVDKIDCYYLDEKIDDFINAAAKYIYMKNNKKKVEN